MANKYMKEWSTSLGIKEMQIKTTLRFYLTLVRKAIKSTTTNAARKGLGESPFAGGSVNSITTMKISMGFPQKTENRTII
jgi:hypothetical protein